VHGLLTKAKGTLLDYDYRIVAEKYNLDLDGERCHDVTFFPIEKARFRSIWYVIGTGTISLIAYGWCIHAGVVSFPDYLSMS
jgi:hypothetical protein